MDSLSKVTTALEALGSKRTGNDWNCPGPTHGNGDRRPSLGVSQGRRGVVLNCSAGCTPEQVLAELGLEWADLFDEPPEHRQEVARYPYTDEDGTVLYWKIRYEPKFFRLQRADGTWGLGDCRRVLYNLPAIITAVKQGWPVWITEGERDADHLGRMGIAATSNHDGASGKWKNEYTAFFKGAEVVIVADRDEPGVRHALDIRAALSGKAASVRIVQSKTTGKGDDISDHLHAGYGLDDLVPYRQKTGKYVPVDWYEAFSSQPAEEDWLFPPLIEAGTLNVLFGLPGVGKSLLVLDMILEILRDGKRVAVFDEENTVRDVVERLKKFGVYDPASLENLSWFSFPQLPALDTPEGGEHLTGIIDDCKPDMVVLDTTTRMVAGEENSASTWLQLYRNSLVPMKQRNIAVLRLDHQGKDASKGQRGSSAKDGDVDTIWRLKFADGGMLALEREKSRSGHGEDWILVERLQDPLRHVFKELDHFPVTPSIRKWADNFDRWDVPRDAGRPTLRAKIQELGEDKVSTTLLAMVAKYRKGLQ